VSAQFSREGLGEGEGGQPEEDLAGEHPGSDVGNSCPAVRSYPPDALALLPLSSSLTTGPQLDDQFAAADLPQLDDSIKRSSHDC
jgi:hypothetical protein